MEAQILLPGFFNLDFKEYRSLFDEIIADKNVNKNVLSKYRIDQSYHLKI